MDFDKEIIRTLVRAGEKGLKSGKIALHVYNACNSIFTPLNYRDVHVYVVQYLTNGVRKRNPIIERCSGYGVYRLNFKSQNVKNIVLKFSEGQQSVDSVEEQDSEDLSLPLLFS